MIKSFKRAIKELKNNRFIEAIHFNESKLSYKDMKTRLIVSKLNYGIYMDGEHYVLHKSKYWMDDYKDEYYMDDYIHLKDGAQG